MTWLEVVLLVFVFTIGYVVFAPFYLEIDSEEDLVRIRFHHLASARLLIKDSSLIIQLKIAGWERQISLTSGERKKGKPELVKRSRKSSQISFHKVMAILKSFKINKCYLNLDCGNMQWNGILFPLFFWVSQLTGKDFRINFTGENKIKLEIENNIARIIWAFLYK